MSTDPRAGLSRANRICRLKKRECSPFLLGSASLTDRIGETYLNRTYAHTYSSDDSGRVRYYEGYLNAVRQAILVDGVDVRSYFA